MPTQFFKNQMVTGDNTYTYDAQYRLKIATGRENDAAVNFTSADNTDDSPFILKHGANDAMNMQNYTQNYNYDAVGNILQLQHSAAQGSYTRNYTYNSGNNRLLTTQIGSNTPYSYNHHTQHGYLTSLPHLSVLNWNLKEEVVATSKQTVNIGAPETTYYQYDSKGKRLRKVTENASTSSSFTKKDSRVYIEGYEFYENFSGTAYVTHSLSLIDTSASLSAGGGQRFVMIESTTNPALAGYLVRYQHPNHQSSSTLETDDVGAVISYEEYHPYGTTSYQAMEKPVRAAAKRYRYTGMERDEETGLSYHSARYYISWLGRWLSPDPIGIGDGVNVYGYCHNNPVTYLDTNGRQTKSPKTKAVTETKGAKAAEAPKESSFWADFGTVLLNKVVNTIMSIGDNPNYEGKMYSPKDKPVSAEQAAKYHPYNTVPETLKLLDPKTHIEGAAEGIGNTAGFIIAVTKKDGKEAANTFFDAVGTVSTIGGLYKNMVKTTTKTAVKSGTGPLKIERTSNNAASVSKHVPTSGAIISNNAKNGTFLIGNYETDLKYILEELNYPKFQKVDFNFSVPNGQKFNLLNVSDNVYKYWATNGGFFTKVNGPWIDAAVKQSADIIVVSKMETIYSAPGVLSGFGKEIHRLEWKHGYRYNPDTQTMVPPSQAEGLPNKTLKNEYTLN